MNGHGHQRIRTARILYELEVPIVYGAWVMRHREFVLVRIDADDGTSGFAYCLTRDGPIPEIVARTIAPRYVGRSGVDPPPGLLRHAVLEPRRPRRRHRHAQPLDRRHRRLGPRLQDHAGSRSPPPSALHEPVRLPATAIVGYPPSLGPDAVADQVAELWAARLAALQGADRSRPRRVRRAACAPPGRRHRRDGSASTPTWSSARPTTSPASTPASPTSSSDGSRTSCRPATRRSSPTAAGRRRRRWRWETSKAARTTRRRCSATRPSTCCAST